jgi:hypothetical protein
MEDVSFSSIHLFRLGLKAFATLSGVPPEKLRDNHGHLQEAGMVVGYVDALRPAELRWRLIPRYERCRFSWGHPWSTLTGANLMIVGIETQLHVAILGSLSGSMLATILGKRASAWF